jgi:LacI family transcriptional regulator
MLSATKVSIPLSNHPKVTLEDVARKVGVSGKTVSRVVRGEANVSLNLRAAVESAIAELGYRPNLAARSLASARSNLIGALSPKVESGYFHLVHAHLGRACSKSGHHLIVEQVDIDSPGVQAQVEKLLAEVRFAGVVLLPGVAQSAMINDLLDKADIPCLAFGTTQLARPRLTVVMDEAAGERALADHLWQQGHRRYGIAMAPENEQYPRGKFFHERLLQLGADLADITRIDIDIWQPAMETGRQFALAIIASKAEPTALFAFNDDVAAGAINVLLTMGINVPADISVVGFDDSDTAKAIWPPLTTIRQPIAMMAQEAITMIARNAAAEPREIICTTEIIIRQSTAPAKLHGSIGNEVASARKSGSLD